MFGHTQVFCLFSTQEESQMKLWKRWSKQRLNALWFNISSVPVVSGRLSLPLRTHDQFRHWTTPTNSAVWPVPYACAQPYHPGIGANQHGIAIGHMNEQSRVGGRRASGLTGIVRNMLGRIYDEESSKLTFPILSLVQALSCIMGKQSKVAGNSKVWKACINIRIQRQKILPELIHSERISGPWIPIETFEFLATFPRSQLFKRWMTLSGG